MSTISRGSKLKLLPSQSREDPGPTIAADQKAWLSSGVIPLKSLSRNSSSCLNEIKRVNGSWSTSACITMSSRSASCFYFLSPSAVISRPACKTCSDFLSPPDHLLPHDVTSVLDQRSNSPVAFLFFSLTLVYSTITLLLNTHLLPPYAQCLSAAL